MRATMMLTTVLLVLVSEATKDFTKEERVIYKGFSFLILDYSSVELLPCEVVDVRHRLWAGDRTAHPPQLFFCPWLVYKYGQRKYGVEAVPNRPPSLLLLQRSLAPNAYGPRSRPLFSSTISATRSKSVADVAPSQTWYLSADSVSPKLNLWSTTSEPVRFFGAQNCVTGPVDQPARRKIFGLPQKNNAHSNKSNPPPCFISLCSTHFASATKLSWLSGRNCWKTRQSHLRQHIPL